MVAIADVESGAQISDRRGATAHFIAGLNEDGLEAGASEVGGGDQPVVSTTHNNRIGALYVVRLLGPRHDPTVAFKCGFIPTGSSHDRARDP